MQHVVSARGAVVLPRKSSSGGLSPRGPHRPPHGRSASSSSSAAAVVVVRGWRPTAAGAPHRRGGLQTAAAYNRESPTEAPGGRQTNPAPAYPPAPVVDPRGTPRTGWGGPTPPPPNTGQGGKWWQLLTTPAAIFAAAFMLSVANPGYLDQSREMLLMRLYEKGARQSFAPAWPGWSRGLDAISPNQQS